jgi:hypothetical protein
MRLQQYLLTEKTFQITKDVNMLYEKGFAEFINSLKDKKGKLFSSFSGQLLKELTFFQGSSSILKSKDAQAAHLVNPIDIYLGIYRSGSFYMPPSMREHPGIQVSLNWSALNLLFANQADTLPENELKRFKNEFGQDRAKASIAHEISHWINDSVHNWNIGTLLKVAAELDKPDLVKLGKASVAMTHFELDAQVHAIKQIKSRYLYEWGKKKWDLLTLKDLFEMYTSLHSIATDLNNNHPEILNIWQKALIKRLSREKLLGKNMRNFVKPSEL